MVVASAARLPQNPRLAIAESAKAAAATSSRSVVHPAKSSSSTRNGQHGPRLFRTPKTHSSENPPSCYCCCSSSRFFFCSFFSHATLREFKTPNSSHKFTPPHETPLSFSADRFPLQNGTIFTTIRLIFPAKNALFPITCTADTRGDAVLNFHENGRLAQNMNFLRPFDSSRGSEPVGKLPPGRTVRC